MFDASAAAARAMTKKKTRAATLLMLAISLCNLSIPSILSLPPPPHQRWKRSSNIVGGRRKRPLIFTAPLPAAALGGGGDPGEDEDDADAFILNGDEDAAEVRLLASDAGGFVIDLHLRGLKVEVAEIGGETFHVLTVSEKATTIEVGRPEIPVVSEVIAVPAGARIRATVIKSPYSAYPGYRVRPLQPPEVDCDPSGEARPFVIDEEFYSQDAFYPAGL